MRVRVLSAKLGLAAGQIVDMDPANALRWIQSGDGEKVDALAGQVDVETATAAPVAEKRKRRG